MAARVLPGGARLPVDGCPRCVDGRAAPHGYRDDGDTRTCWYRCPRCRHQWQTSWSIEALGDSEGRR